MHFERVPQGEQSPANRVERDCVVIEPLEQRGASIHSLHAGVPEIADGVRQTGDARSRKRKRMSHSRPSTPSSVRALPVLDR